MKITLLTYGSRGDVQPFVALGMGLQSAGHQVRLAAPHRFADFAASYGLAFTSLAGNPEDLSARLNQARGNVVGVMKGMAEYVMSVAEPVARAAFAACQDAELVVHSFLFTTGGHSWARAHGVPDVSVQLFPTFAPTRAFPAVALPDLPSGRLSAFSHRLSTWMFWHVGNWGYHKLRGRAPEVFELKLYWPWAPPLEAEPHRPRPTTPLLYAYSPVVLPRPGDWRAPYIHIPGYFFLKESRTYQPPQALAAFLEGGEPPVCVTFGSMVNPESERIDTVVRAALEQTGRRGIVLRGWGGTNPAGQEGEVLYLDAAPHEWLLPRCQAVIHHGGAGTTAAGLRAGIPNIVTPHAVDQAFWGKRVAALGAGPAPVDLGKLTVETLAGALAQTQDPVLQARARAIGQQIRAEDGVGQAVRIIEAHAAAFNGRARR